MRLTGQAVALAATFLALLPVRAESGSYIFTKIADTTNTALSGAAPDAVFTGALSINDLGTVAFGASGCGGGIFLGDGATLVPLVCNDTAPAGLTIPSQPALSINRSGTVAFFGLLRGGVLGDLGGVVLTVHGGAVTVIAAPDAVDPLSPFRRIPARAPAINEAGAVAFIAEPVPLPAGGSGTGVYVGGAGTVRGIAALPSPSDAIPDALGGTVINNAGMVAFAAHRGVPPDGRVAIHKGDGTTITVIAEEGSLFGDLRGAIAMNDHGAVAFVALPDPQTLQGAVGIFVGDGTAITPVASAGPFQGFERGGVAINGTGTVAFLATAMLDGIPRRGIFIGPDPVKDRVIAVGDSVGGSTVVDVVSGGHLRTVAINEAGQIAFLARLADGRMGVYRADPVAAPTAPAAPAGSRACAVGCSEAAAGTSVPLARSTASPLFGPSGTMTVSGTVYADEGVTPLSATLRLVLGGSTAFTTTSASDGTFAFTGLAPPAPGTVITLYLSQNPGKTGAVVTRAAGPGDLTGLDLYQNRLIVRHEDAGPLTNAALGVCTKANGPACGIPDLHFAVAGGALTVDSDWMLYIWPAKTFAPGGAVTLSPGAPASAPGGDVKFAAATSVFGAGANPVSVGGDWINTAGGVFSKAANQTVTFSATGPGFGLSGVMTGVSAFEQLAFNGVGGEWTIRGPIRTSSTSADSFVIRNGVVTLGDGPGDNLEVRGGMKIAVTPGETGTFQTAPVPQGGIIVIDINANATLPACPACKVLVGAGSGTGQGSLKLRRNTVLRLNPGRSGGTSDTGMDVDATGYLEIQGSRDYAGTLHGPTTETLMTDTTKAWSPGENNGKVVRITNLSSPAFGRTYSITGTTATGILRADTSSTPTSVTAILGSGPSRKVCTAAQGLIAANREGVGRHLKDQTGTTGLLKIVYSVNNDPACPGATDALLVISEPDPLLILEVGDTIVISDGVRMGDAYEILDYAHVTAEAGAACSAPAGGPGVGYIWGKAGSETLIRYAEVCNLGGDFADEVYGISFTSVNGANANEGFTIDSARVHTMGYRPINLYSSRNNNGLKGVRQSSISGAPSYGIYMTAGSNNNAFSHNRIWDTTNSISLEPGATSNVVSYNDVFANRGLNGNGIHSASANNTIAFNHAYGNASNGLRLTKSALRNTVIGNHVYGNQDAGISLESSSNAALLSNRVYANDVGLSLSVPTNGVAPVTGIRVIGDEYGVQADNRFGDVAYTTARAHTVSLFNARLVSSNDPNRVARSGNIANGQSSSLSRVVTGPGTLTFDWAVSSEQGFDTLTFSVDDVPQASISGSVPWMTQSVPLGSGTHTIRFTYVKDGSDAQGLDAGLVDNVAMNGALLDDFESGSVAGWTLSGNDPWRNVPRVESVAGVTPPGAWLISRRHKGVPGATLVVGQYAVPGQVVETPQNETVERFNFADDLWEKSATPHAYAGTGSEDPDLNYDLSGAVLAGGPYHYRASVTTAGSCGTAVFTVTRNGAPVGDAVCGTVFTDTMDGVSIRFRIDGGAPTPYGVGDTYTFTVWDASGDRAVPKTITMQQDGDRFIVGPGKRIELKGEGGDVNTTRVTRGGRGGYQFVIDGAIDANGYVFDYLGGIGHSAGLVLHAGALVTSLDNGSFDNFGVAGAGPTAFIQVDGSLIGTGTPSRTIHGIRFGNATGFATCNMNGIGPVGGNWLVTYTGPFGGENFDCRDGGADPTPGHFAWAPATPPPGAPTITSLSPNSVPAGGPAFTLTVNGSNFAGDAIVRWNGADRVTTFVNGAQLRADIPAGDIATAGTALVTAFNPGAGGGTSNPQTFTITPASCPAAVIVDNLPPGQSSAQVQFTGTWTTSTAPNPFGVNGSLYSNGGGLDTYTWKPPVFSSTQACTYQVSVWWTAHANRSTTVPLTVSGHSGGPTTLTVNERINGGQWNLHGTYTFPAGAQATVQVTDQNGQAAADAVRFVLAAPDTTPPETTLTGGPTGTITVSTATFTWTGTDDTTPTANLLYAYRLDPLEPTFSAFGSATAKTYSNLTNGPYTFYVKAKDQAGNEDSIPASRAFTVAVPAGACPAAVIVDNLPPGQSSAQVQFTGTWTTSTAPNPFGVNGSLYSNGGGLDTYTWKPPVFSSAQACTYQVYVWWTAHANRSTTVPLTVNGHGGGPTTLTVNERINGGQWNLHGTYTFPAGAQATVQVTDQNGQAAADAVRFVLVP